MTHDPLGDLGLPPDADADDVRRARRELAKRHHPDLGGDAAAMQKVNVAATEAISRLGPETTPTQPAPSSTPAQPTGARGPAVADPLSFVVEALPAEAFEALLLVGATIGEIVDDDPPYLLEVRLGAPTSAWCRLDLVPDAGSATVSITLAAEEGFRLPRVDDVRDRWIDELNQLDWDQL